MGFVAGVSDAASIVDSDGEQAGLQIDLTPVGAALLVGCPPSEVTNHVVPLPDLLGSAAYALVERLAQPMAGGNGSPLSTPLSATGWKPRRVLRTIWALPATGCG